MIADEYFDYHNKAKNLIAKAQENADLSGDPFMVTWNHGDMYLIPAYSYSSEKHGCAEFIRYPKNYAYPNRADKILEREDLPLW